MIEPVNRKRKSLLRLALLVGLALSLGGCGYRPLSEDEPTEGGPSTGGSEPGTTAQRPAGHEAGGGIVVGETARNELYTSLSASGHALAPGETGYFIDVHEGRMRQVLAGTQIHMQRIGEQLLLTIPGKLSFDTDSAQVVEAAKSVLEDIAAVLLEFDRTLVSVFGHTDDRGDAAYNQSLSERRAVAVARILAQNGVAMERLVGIGYGQQRPVIENDSEEARTTNRRIEILIEPIVASRQRDSEQGGGAASR